jgi:hypothetical protein
MALHVEERGPHCSPALDLPLVFFGQAAALLGPAIPLEPAARVIGMKPALSRQTESGKLASTPK